jgi:zinc protease
LQQEQVGRTNDGALAGILAELLYVDRTMKYYAQLETTIGQLSPKQVVEALRKFIDPKKLVIVDAGDFSGKQAAAK